MNPDFEVFDLKRIFIGDAPLIFLLEIVFRTLVMYSYSIFLLRLLGKRGMGQLSNLELAIIITFGSAIGDPMINASIPILHGVVAVTAVTIFQINLERFINKNKKVEAFMEGEPNLVVDKGVIKWDCLTRDNLSKEDLFRSLRSKDVEHLGQIEKAFFETSGQISVMFRSQENTKPGLSLIPENEIEPEAILKAPTPVPTAGLYCCLDCGNLKSLAEAQKVSKCELCGAKEWVVAKK
ncbi:DUF421 domain-containing protein [Adhaeribacter aerolatus]|uniref:DUF421 domain-containing protein n=1 Tax=Adhaeribacter aerolatus TaxID=670289 RepID=A0A512AWN3_9BACT|nr:DUF421 domain-containing protein [Adhaeribacter aerolatus]GEO04131.1 DUF421 domain-containing protein [Adhaeribacter aerolatus]